MRLLLAVVDYFPFGGMQRTYRRIAEALLARGHDVLLAAATWEGDHPKGSVHVDLRIRAATNHTRNQAFADRLRTFVANERASGRSIDVVCGFSKIPGLDVYYAGDPCFAARMDDEKRGAIVRLLPRYRRFLEHEKSVFGKGGATEILLIAHVEEEKYVRHYGTEKERFHRLPPGIDRGRLGEPASDREARARARQSIGLTDRDFAFLLIGAQFRTKGVDRAIETLAAVVAATPKESRRFCLIVVGGDDARTYRELAARLGVADRVRFVGAQTDVGLFLRAADLLIHPARVENTGTTLLEAMILGLPVVTTNRCGFYGHVVAAEGGVVLPEPYDSESFGRAVDELVGDRDRLARMSASGEAYGKSADLYALIEKAADVIETIAAKRRGAPANSARGERS